MKHVAPAPTLEYADRPSGSRLLVERDGDGALVVIDPATGVWEQVKWFGVVMGTSSAVWAVLVLLFAWWFGLSLATARRVVRTTNFSPVTWQFLLQLLIAMLVTLALCVAAGTWSRTYRVHRGVLETKRHGPWPLRTARQQTFRRDDIAIIRPGRFQAFITLVSPQQKRMVDLMVTRRADAKWLARLLSHELRLTE